uniref:Uncharacterized protein n=1 Tax=Amphimedon queenslandica TaxID=400682 RepID=A0A1X7UZ83_AMPQE
MIPFRDFNEFNPIFLVRESRERKENERIERESEEEAQHLEEEKAKTKKKGRGQQHQKAVSSDIAKPFPGHASTSGPESAIATHLTTGPLRTQRAMASRASIVSSTNESQQGRGSDDVYHSITPVTPTLNEILKGLGLRSDGGPMPDPISF